MIGMGFNFSFDKYSLKPTPNNLNNITILTIKNGIFTYLGATQDTKKELDCSKIIWDYETLLNADFSGNLNAGNVDFIAENVTSMKIKRKKKSDFNWVSLYDIPIKKVEDFNFERFDSYNEAEMDYDYAIVPMYGEEEGNYITNSIYSQFGGLFLVDKESIIKFYYELSYSNNERVQSAGVMEPYGNEYPIYIKNGKLNYEKGSVEALIVSESYDVIDPRREVNYLKTIKEKLTNGNAKILKDMNGNMWMVVIVDNVTISYVKEIGNRIGTASFNWVEIGNSNDQKELYDNNLIDVQR